MKKIKKGKKMLLMMLIAIIVVLAIVAIVSLVRKNKSKGPEYENVVIPLPETTYSDMEVKNIQMEYLKDNDETVIKMEIHNTTSNKIEKEKFDVVWIGPEEKILGKINTQIKDLDVGEQHNLSVILPGNLTETKEVKLIKK